MRTEQKINLYLNTVINEGLYSNIGRLKFYTYTLFRKIDFKNKIVLDIGGGYGLFSFYASCRGAKKVVCIEPEAEGSSQEVTEKFHKLNKCLECCNIVFKEVTLQTLEPQDETFDIILLHNSINHLDETACINLQKDSISKAVYQDIFTKIFSLSSKGAKLLICDCSRYNFYAMFKLRNPFVPTIEWHKHQSPEVWADMLSETGFMNPIIRWTSSNRLRNWGRVLFGNKLMAYFLTSHFYLTMDKS